MRYVQTVLLAAILVALSIIALQLTRLNSSVPDRPAVASTANETPEQRKARIHAEAVRIAKERADISDAIGESWRIEARSPAPKSK